MTHSALIHIGVLSPYAIEEEGVADLMAFTVDPVFFGETVFFDLIEFVFYSDVSFAIPCGLCYRFALFLSFPLPDDRQACRESFLRFHPDSLQARQGEE